MTINYDLIIREWQRRNTKFITNVNLKVHADAFAAGIKAADEINIDKFMTTKFSILVEMSYPMWIIIASSLIGIALMTIMFIICYRIGWFDRRDMSGENLVNYFDIKTLI